MHVHSMGVFLENRIFTKFNLAKTNYQIKSDSAFTSTGHHHHNLVCYVNIHQHPDTGNTTTHPGMSSVSQWRIWQRVSCPH